MFPSGSSYNVYMFGGQNLIPYGSQIQYDDMWILSVPSFTWIPVNTNSQSVPYPRSGHTCNVWDGQMVVAGGYIGKDISCETPGIYIFNLSSLSWQNSYTSLGSTTKGNPFSQQTSQKGIDPAKAGLDGSFGYQVPLAVQSVIGGNGNGGATITAPVQTATSGPMASGKPITYTVTGANGAVVTEFSNPNNGNSNDKNDHHGPNVGAIAAGVVAGILAIAVVYLAFCAFIYRKQLHIYKQHMAMAQERQEMSGAGGGLFDPPGSPGYAGEGYSKHLSAGQSSLIGPYHTRESNSIDTSMMQQTSSGDNQSASDSSEHLMDGFEPSYYGVLLHPRRSLRIVNRD
jgi:hypothetical protein